MKFNHAYSLFYRLSADQKAKKYGNYQPTAMTQNDQK